MTMEATGKVASSAIDAMRSTPLAIALLAVNVAFLGFSGYVLKHVADASVERNKLQLGLISKLIEECRPPAPPK